MPPQTSASGAERLRQELVGQRRAPSPVVRYRLHDASSRLRKIRLGLPRPVRDGAMAVHRVTPAVALGYRWTTFARLWDATCPYQRASSGNRRLRDNADAVSAASRGIRVDRNESVTTPAPQPRAKAVFR